MKITFKRDNLLKKLALVNGNIKQKNLTPINDYCHVSFTDDSILFKSSNEKHVLEVQCKYEFIDGEAESFICDTRTIFKVFSNLRAEDVFISLEQKEGENNKTIIFGALNLKKKYEVGTYYNAEDYPIMPSEDKIDLFKMSGDLLHESLTKGTVFNLEGDIGVPSFAGVGLKVESDAVFFQSSNKVSVLFQSKIPMEVINPTETTIAIDKSIMDSMETFKQSTEVLVSISKTSIFMTDGVNKISSRLIAGKWPNGFDVIMGKNTDREYVKFNRDELLMTLKRISVMAGIEHAVSFEFKPFNKESCTLSSSFEEFNKKGSEEIPCEMPSEQDMTARMNCMFLMQIISNLSGENIYMSIGTSQNNYTSEIKDDSNTERKINYLITGMIG